MNHINKFEMLGVTFASRDWSKQRKTSAVIGGNPAGDLQLPAQD